jgi:phosphatidate cytidylyltransferase
LTLSNLLVRTVSGLVFVAILFAATYLGYEYLTGLFAVFIIVAGLELHRLLLSESNVPKWFISGLAVMVFAGIVSLFTKQESWAYAFLGLSLLLLSSVSSKFGIRAVGHVLFGGIYLALPFATFIMIGFIQSSEVYSFVLPMILFILIWTNDTFAYLIGKYLGKRPIIPAISPNKTVEGTFGGIVFTIIMVFILKNDSISVASWLVLAVIVSISSFSGDVFESFLKRNASVKDSGSIIPGHGGMLDRFDAFFVASPVAYAYLSLVY